MSSKSPKVWEMPAEIWTQDVERQENWIRWVWKRCWWVEIGFNIPIRWTMSIIESLLVITGTQVRSEVGGEFGSMLKPRGPSGKGILTRPVLLTGTPKHMLWAVSEWFNCLEEILDKGLTKVPAECTRWAPAVLAFFVDDCIDGGVTGESRVGISRSGVFSLITGSRMKARLPH